VVNYINNVENIMSVFCHSGEGRNPVFPIPLKAGDPGWSLFPPVRAGAGVTMVFNIDCFRNLAIEVGMYFMGGGLELK